ncbi:oxaloacetate decarboxylase [Microbacteriaceae bacterium K1510]|nr:oxaloacetate decarboxylase [Microbacteriaceae bacterium K1510]
MTKKFDSGLLRKLLTSGKVTRVPCAYDGFSARIAQQVGFPVVGFTGNAVSGSLLGVPDIGALGMWENVSHAGKIARGLDVPLICDADTGYGGVMNVVRTVREFEAAGVAAIHLEDQVTPKRCGLLPQGIPVVSRAESVAKMKAAVDARDNRDFLIIARTDAASQHGIEEAAARARSYIETGADAAIVMGAYTPDALRYVADVVRAPLVVVIQETPPTADLTDDVLEKVGCAFTMHAAVARYAVVKALQTALGTLRRQGTTRDIRGMMATFEEYNAALGLDEWLALESKYDA